MDIERRDFPFAVDQPEKLGALLGWFHGKKRQRVQEPAASDQLVEHRLRRLDSAELVADLELAVAILADRACDPDAAVELHDDERRLRAMADRIFGQGVLPTERRAQRI